MQIKYIDRQTNKIKTETPPGERLLRLLYSRSIGKATLLPIVKRKLVSKLYGKRMFRSSSTKKIKKFVDTLNIDLSESQKSLDEFTSFNDFFYRKLKPGTRPIGEGLISPGDGRLLAFEQISDLKYFFVKGEQFTLFKFLKNRQLAQNFQDASLFILRLAPADYHRFHFPYKGVPSRTTTIKGRYYSVSPYALANNFVRVFCENKRAYCVLKTKNKGDMIIVPVGATMVGSIIETYEADKMVEKGDEMGYFAFGGSSIVLLVNKDKITIDADILEHTRNGLETYVKMGERIGQ